MELRAQKFNQGQNNHYFGQKILFEIHQTSLMIAENSKNFLQTKKTSCCHGVFNGFLFKQKL